MICFIILHTSYTLVIKERKKKKEKRGKINVSNESQLELFP